LKNAVELARVLLVDDDPASRLTLQTVLRAGGYSVDSAASAAEAVDKLDEEEYSLVLSDLWMESPEAGYRVIAHARTMQYRPATAIITATYGSEAESNTLRPESRMLIEPEDVPDFLERVANLIGGRASKRVNRSVRMAAAAGQLA
jgi:CheY-like chemotaxis protein